MSEPKITVIIPTRERCDVLGKTLETVLAQDYERVQVIVSDNNSADHTRDVVGQFNDPRLRYINPGRRLSMSHHWEFALTHVDSGWLTILGDDDGLLPGALTKVSSMVDSNSVEAIRSRVCGYAWPSASGSQFGTLTVPIASGCEMRESSAWLQRALDGRAGYTDLPMLYNGGFVAHRVLERVQRMTGSFYRSCIPDVYSAVAIASVTKRYLFCHEPLAINGASRHSTGTAYFLSTQKKEGSSADLFHSEGIIPIHDDIAMSSDGRFPKSLQVMLFESYLQSAPLRPGAEPVSRTRQLELALASGVPNDPDLDDWARTYSRHHKLDYANARRAATATRRMLRMAAAARNFIDEVRTFECGSSDLPLRDVYEAALAAASIREFGTHHRTWLGVLARRLMHRFRPGRLRSAVEHP
jgi:glycosyltransferase involved in cell wall biosynthesis